MKKKSHRQIKKEAYWERQRQNKRLRRDLLFLIEMILLVCVICDVAVNGNARIVTSVLRQLAFISVAGYVIFVVTSIVIVRKKERLWRDSSDAKGSSGKGNSTRGLQAAGSTDDRKKESIDTLLQAGLIDKEEYDQRINRIKRNS